MFINSKIGGIGTEIDSNGIRVRNSLDSFSEAILRSGPHNLPAAQPSSLLGLWAVKE
jgi:hypothetical protein